MKPQNPNNGEMELELRNRSSGGVPFPSLSSPPFVAGSVGSSLSTPFVSAPSSPGRIPSATAGGGYYFSAPASPMHFLLSSAAATLAAPSDAASSAFDFEFSARSPASASAPTVAGDGMMTSADELFLNGRIRPLRLSSGLQRRQSLAPLPDLDEEPLASGDGGRDLRLQNGSVHRRTRSMSPLRNPRSQWQEDGGGEGVKNPEADQDRNPATAKAAPASDASPSSDNSPASASRSSSSGRNSKRWIFLKDLLYRSKSEGRGRETGKEKSWISLSFSPSKDRSRPPPSQPPPSPLPSPAKSSISSSPPSKKGGSFPPSPRAPPQSAHERHYTANRAQAEEMRRRTFLPYRHELFGCLGFTSRSYGAVNGLARNLKPVHSR